MHVYEKTNRRSVEKNLKDSSNDGHKYKLVMSKINKT